MIFRFDCMVWSVSESWIRTALSWAHWPASWPQQYEGGDGVIICWNVGMCHTSQRASVMFLFCLSSDPKSFKREPINFRGVVLMVEVMDFIAKSNIISDVIKHIHDNASVIQDIHIGQRFGQLQSAWRSFQLPCCGHRGFWGCCKSQRSLLQWWNHMCEIIYLQFDRFVVTKTTISNLLYWIKMIWNGFVKCSIESTTNVNEGVMLIF